MKHLFKMLVVAVLLTGKVFAQTDPVRIELDHIFQYIDKSQVPSGYLDEYGPQFAEKKWHTGVLSDSNFIQFISGFRFLYNDIEQARIYNGAPVLTTLDVVNNTISQLPASNSTPLIFLIGKYATAKEDAINLNLFSNNGNNQVLDVPGRTQSPYIENNFFAACPVLEDAPQTNTISLSYNPSLVYSNCGKTISSVAVDFLKGAGYQTIATNTAVNYTYTDSSGYKKFTIRVNCTDGSIYYCYSQQYVTVTPVGSNVSTRYSTLTDVELANPAITIPFIANEHYGAKVFIRYSKKRQGTALANKLVKPFIVVEGYDLHDAAPSLGRKTNYDINSLLLEWNNLAQSTPGYDLSQQLDEDAGYDLVFVDYYTMDYIENNSKMLEKVIDQINTLKVNNAVGIREKNVVMGISLGGVLSRYTLAKMTKNRGTSSTDTRLLLTYDSPHQGGNVPLGFQHFLQDFGEVQIFGKKLKDNVDQLKEFYKLNNQAATSQLLLLRVLNGTGTVVNNTFFATGGVYRTMVDFTTSQMLSTPPLYEFKAIAQGSQCSNWVMQPNTLLTQFNENISTGRILLMGLYLVKYRMALQVNSLPAQGTLSQISYVRMQRNIKYFYSAIGSGWKTTSEFIRNSTGSTIPWDGVPGGTSSATGRSGGQFGGGSTIPNINSGNTFVGNVLRILLYGLIFNVNTNINIPFQQDIFTTVPINSSLDLQNVSLASFNQSYIFPINGLAGSGAKTYIANEKFTGSVNGVSTTLFNYEHADFTRRQSQWMYNEMENKDNSTINCEDAQSCSSTVFGITGDNFVCTNKIFNLNPTPASGNVIWNITPSGIATFVVNADKTVTVTKQQNGIISLTGTTTVCNQTFTASKQITVGTPTTFITSWFAEYCSTYLEAYCTAVPGTTVYSWELDNAVIAETSTPYFYVNGIPTGNHQLKVRLTNACGLSAYSKKILFTTYVCNPPLRVSMNPNPTSDNLNVAVDISAMQQAGVTNTSWMQIKEIKIYDKFGLLKKRFQYSTSINSVSLPVYDLPSDVYSVHITNGVHYVIKQIIIQR